MNAKEARNIAELNDKILSEVELAEILKEIDSLARKGEFHYRNVELRLTTVEKLKLPEFDFNVQLSTTTVGSPFFNNLQYDISW